MLEGGPDDYYLRVWNRSASELFRSVSPGVNGQDAGAGTGGRALSHHPGVAKDGKRRIVQGFGTCTVSRTSGIRFYHESFRDFVLSQTPNLDTDLHSRSRRTARWLKSPITGQPTSSITTSGRGERGYHGSTVHAGVVRQGGIRCVQPELLLSDLDEIRRDRLEAGDALESIRLLLLTARLHFRYNQVFALHAAQFAVAAVVLRSPAQSLRFIVRQGHLICSVDDSLGDAPLVGARWPPRPCRAVVRELRTRFWAACESVPPRTRM